ncbi:MAG: ATP phosphoribosyltransferase [Sulfobacillus acidophilus]|uniref:ATP phosphoribosyltransferase n=1 Tax=Sulfobacillus acidophilus TaxID=53633 RepID=A0A2T2WE36_9FIRM|nr:MAG: ATP phosphoribosyltransferase [Sulfobacillus acidophilus]
MPPYSLTIAVCKGRVLDAVAELWAHTPWRWPDLGRQLWFPPCDNRPGLIIARGTDIPALVQGGIAAFGIVGRDILEEQWEPDILEVLDLGIAPCRMVLASLDGQWPQGPVRVATKYPEITRRYFREQSHPVEVVKLSGSLELSPHIGLAPYIVDIVQTGQTLKQHHLREVETLFASTARLVANPVAWRLGEESEYIYRIFEKAVRTNSRVSGGRQ